MRTASATRTGALVAAWLGIGCASIREAPNPVVVDPVVVEPPPDGLAEAWIPASPTNHHGIEATVALPEPPELWLPPEIVWQPRKPTQGTAIGVWILRRPGSRTPTAISLELAGRPVGLGETADGWFGIAALPLDSAGPMTLAAHYRVEGDSVIEESRLLMVAVRRYDSRRLSVATPGRMDRELEERIRRERELIGGAISRFSAFWQGGEGFQWPRPHDVTSGFGQHRLFNGETRSRHMGLDLRGRRSDPVRAPAAGRVALVGSFYYQGNAVYIDHGLGVFSGLFHLASAEVSEGEWVDVGRVVGRVGSTGRSTAPHLHWSAYVGGENVDPASLLQIDLRGLPAAASSERDR